MASDVSYPRHGRQMLVVGIGEAGQRRIQAAQADVDGDDTAGEIGRRYANGAGFASTAAAVESDESVDSHIEGVRFAGPRAVLTGARRCVRAMNRALGSL